MVVLGVVLGVVCYYAIYAIVGLVMTMLLGVLASIPLVGDLLAIFFRTRGDSPEMLSIIIGAVIAYFVVSILLDKMCKSRSKSARKALGIVLIVLAVVNILLGGVLFPNIITAIAGVVFFL